MNTLFRFIIVFALIAIAACSGDRNIDESKRGFGFDVSGKIKEIEVIDYRVLNVQLEESDDLSEMSIGMSFGTLNPTEEGVVGDFALALLKLTNIDRRFFFNGEVSPKQHWTCLDKDSESKTLLISECQSIEVTLPETEVFRGGVKLKITQTGSLILRTHLPPWWSDERIEDIRGTSYELEVSGLPIIIKPTLNLFPSHGEEPKMRAPSSDVYSEHASYHFTPYFEDRIANTDVMLTERLAGLSNDSPETLDQIQVGYFNIATQQTFLVRYEVLKGPDDETIEESANKEELEASGGKDE